MKALAIVATLVGVSIVVTLLLDGRDKRKATGRCRLCGYPTLHRDTSGSVHELCIDEDAAGRDPQAWRAFPSKDCM